MSLTLSPPRPEQGALVFTAEMLGRKVEVTLTRGALLELDRNHMEGRRHEPHVPKA